ncbi:MAG: hypothetical protein LBU27_04405 [Candidatus Peribacteria bacterium]|jgi:hypothetical protein|nr:hypothetical protein [Candidatus Peribacteria bacterium]
MLKQNISAEYLVSLVEFSRSLEYFTPEEIVETWSNTELLSKEDITPYLEELVALVKASRKKENRYLSSVGVLALIP